MPNPTLVPLFGGPPWAAGGHHPPTHFPFAVFPFLGAAMFCLLLLLVLGALFLAKRGHLGPPPWVAARMQTPEFEARRILAERFAKGDITSDEFLERASVLNWTPGADYFPSQGKKKHKR